MSMLNVRELSSKFNNVRSLDGVSFTLDGGKFLALLGPSVSGKTTILRAISGDESLDSGRAIPDGVNVTRTPARGRGVSELRARSTADNLRETDPTPARRRVRRTGRVIDRIRHRAGAEHTICVVIGRAKVEPRRLRTRIPMGSRDVP